VISDLHVVNAQGGVCHVWTTGGGPEVKAHTLKKNHLIYLCLCMYAVIAVLFCYIIKHVGLKSSQEFYGFKIKE